MFSIVINNMHEYIDHYNILNYGSTLIVSSLMDYDAIYLDKNRKTNSCPLVFSHFSSGN